MTNRIDGSRNLANIESRPNLIFLLQELARQSQARASAYKSFLGSFITDEKIEE